MGPNSIIKYVPMGSFAMVVNVLFDTISMHAAASPGDNVVLKTRYVAALPAASDSQTFPAATLSAMWKTVRKYRCQPPRGKSVQ